MIKHRNKPHASGTKEEKRISSAEEFKEHVGRVSERVKESYGQDNNRHKQPEFPIILFTFTSATVLLVGKPLVADSPTA